MRLHRFHWCLRSRGPDLSAWPERDREAALVLLRQSAPARQLLADAFEHDALPCPDPAVQCRMLARLHDALCPASRAVAGLRWGALGACLLAGWLIGAALDLDPSDVFTPNLEGGFQVAALP